MEFTIEDLKPTVVFTQPILCCEIVPEKKSVRFSDDVVVKSVEMNRTDNINPDKVSYGPEDFSPFSCKQGGYIEKTSDRMILVGNNSFNKFHGSLLFNPIPFLYVLHTIKFNNLLII